MPSRTLLRSIFFTSLALPFAVAGPAFADSSHARVIRLSLVQGEVRFARDFHHDSLSDQKVAWEDAVLNLPIRQGYALATVQGRAEVEFENGAMAFLDQNTVLEFYDLSLEDGAKTTRLVLRQGIASFYVNPASGDYFSVTGGDFTVEATSRANFRLDNFDDGSVVNVSKGHVSVLRKNKTTLLAKGQSLSMRAGDEKSETVGRQGDADDFDRWVSGREDSVLTATTAAQQYVNSPYYSSGLADLYTYGSWYPISSYGYCWRPYGVGYGWSPFDNGGWYMDPFFGWGFIGYQPWGWLPYHYGGWVFDPVFGWLWSPFGLGFAGGFGGFVPFRPATGVFVRSGTGLLGVVPVHPLDARGKTPINLAQGVFPVTGGALSTQRIAAETGGNWKVVKAAPRDTFVGNSLTASTAPVRVSRTLLANSRGSRVITMDRNSSITYDPREHKFVNTNDVPAAANAVASEKTQATAQANARGPEPSLARGSAVPSAQRANMPPSPARVPSTSAHRFAMPSSSRSSGSYGGFGGGARSGGGPSWRGSSGSSMSSAHASSAPAAHPSGGGGRPH